MQQQPPPQSAERAPFRSSPAAAAAEAAPPISARRPTSDDDGATGAAVAAAAAAAVPNWGEELGAGDDTLLDVGGLAAGNRWPRQETLALLKIRSDMDAAFRDASLKGPLWDEVSRKLGDLGYKRSSKKCKEKFENVHKYYKRTKEGRAGRQDGKSYRFFDQLEALHSNIAAMPSPTPPPQQNPLVRSPPEPQIQVSAPTPIAAAPPPPPPPGPELSFSTDTPSSSSSDYDSERGDHGGGTTTTTGSGRKKRKRRMMEFFEGMMRQVMERQESMHQRFLEALEKREQDRTIREEAWRRQEMSRITRERELAAQERSAAASRDAAIVSFLQKITGQSVQLQTPPPPPPLPQQSKVIDQKQQQQRSQHSQNEHQIATPPPPLPACNYNELVPVERSSEPQDPTSSRWPKSEVHALIQLRSGLDSRYQEAGPKGPLWEEISARMQRLGCNRSAKRCKEKWENINKYFKKVKESNKRRPEDAKTCPYFHQLDALYRNKHNNGGGGTLSALDQAPSNLNVNPNPSPITMIAPLVNQKEMENKSSNGGNGDNAGGDNGGMIMKKPEDIMKELMGQSNNDYGEHDSDNMDEYGEDDEEDDDEDGNGQYRIQFQKQNVVNNGSSGTAPNNGGGKAAGSFLAMVR